MMIYSSSIDTIKATLDECIFKNTLGNMELSVYMAINSQNVEIFKILLDKGCECNYLCMSELICRYNKASSVSDSILVRNFGEMLEYAVLTGAEIDNYQIQYLMIEGTAKLLENIRNNYAEPKWKKLCNISRTGDKTQFVTKKLRQLAFNLNLDFSMSPTQICEKLEEINNMDRMDYVKKSIERQEERLVKNLVEAGKVREGESLERIKCNFRSRVVNNPYAYNDARMAFYREESTGEIWCFTSDLFKTMIDSGKNPYNNNPLPLVFKETIKTQYNLLKILDLNHSKDSKSIEDSLKDTFEVGREISNSHSENMYVSAVNLFRLYTGDSEVDFREKSLNRKTLILKNFILASFGFASDCNDMISTDFLSSIRQLRDADDLSEAEIMKDFKIYRMLKESYLVQFFPNSNFSELFLMNISYSLNHFENKFSKSKDDNGQYFYSDKYRSFSNILNNLIFS